LAQVEVEGLSKTFRGRRSSVAALREVDLTVPTGEFAVLLGSSGSGKSTLLRCVAGLERADQGRVAIGGTVVFDRRRRVDRPPNRREVGMVFQSYALWPHMTVAQNVGYPVRVRGQGSEADRVAEVLRMVDCGHLADRYPSALSGGQQQRVALARALVARPRVLLFDEPLSNVDALLRRELREQIKHLHEEIGFTGIYVTHDQAEALYIGTRVAVMREGAIEQMGTPEAVYRFPVSEEVARFLGARNRLALSDIDNPQLLGRVGADGPAQGAGSLNVYVRPERIRLSRRSEAGKRDLTLGRVTVRSVAYAGEWMEYELELGKTVLHVLSPERSITLRPGEHGWAAVDVDDLLAYRYGQLVHPAPADRISEMG
jgi:iron(III) transport system ATP-binding protein